jgi:toxin-antitoxin system PIN domain toxin
MRALLAQWGSDTEAWFITWSVVYEFLRVATHRSVFAHPLTFADAWSFIESLRASPSFGILVETERHAEVVRDLTLEYPHTSCNRLHDLHIAALMREHGVVEIRTADTDFHQFKFLRVVNPL